MASNLEADSWLNDILFTMGEKDWIRGDWIFTHAVNAGEKEGDIRRRMAPALERAGYVKHRNPDRMDGRWYRKGDRGITLYRKVGASIPEGDIMKYMDSITLPPS